MSANTVTMTVDLTTKEITLTGQMAIREEITVRVSGANAVTTYDALRLGICKGRVLYAICNTFTDQTTYFEGTLSLNTEEIVDYFESSNGRATKVMEVACWDVLNNRLLVNDTVSVMNNPYSDSMADPTEVDPVGGAGAETFTTAEKTKLSGIEVAADVTDATNVNAAGAVMESDYDANTILAATTDNTPVTLTVSEQSVVGRMPGGNIAALTAAQVATLVDGQAGVSKVKPDSLGTADYLDGIVDGTSVEITAGDKLGVKDNGITAAKIGFDADDISDGSTKVIMTTSERSKLSGISDSADVVDATTVAATGALMDSDFTTNGFMQRTGAGAYTGEAYPLSVAHGGTNSLTALSNNRVMKSSAGSIVEAAAITASRALVSDSNGIPTHSVTTTTELSYMSGVTSAVQTQIDSKVDLVGNDDIEITDSTKGIIMLVGATRVRAKLISDSGSYTWQFTSL